MPVSFALLCWLAVAQDLPQWPPPATATLAFCSGVERNVGETMIFLMRQFVSEVNRSQQCSAIRLL